ncbi:MAG: hypothetical protein JW896_02275 [Deltaproteobacteria bacterium]|nr:hypothetical protein [Deltaproteobacteria bacterium]
MKAMKKVFPIFVLSVMFVSCATRPHVLPEKYNLDDDLELIEQITTIKAPSLEQVDNQSVILKTNWDEYYLLVLHRPIDTRYSNPQIGISRTISTITSGIDRVYVSPSSGSQSYVIDKIYKLKGKEQAREIKERFSED